MEEVRGVLGERQSHQSERGRGGPGPAGRTTLRGLRRQEEVTAWLFVLPVGLGILIFQIYPVLYSLYISLTDWSFVTPPKWIGLGNFVGLFTDDPTFVTAMTNSAFYTLGTVVPGVALALVFAVLLNQEIRGRFIYRSIFFVPVVATLVSISILWSWIYEPSFGILNYALKLVGIDGPTWLGSSHWAMPALIIMAIWHDLGFNIVIFLAGLQSISRDYYEAAAIDGAGSLSKFRHVTLPLLSPVTFFVVVLAVINAFQVFTIPFVMTQGGPANSTLTVVLYLYNQAFQFEHMGVASAIAYCLFVVVVVLTLLNFQLQRVWVFYEESQ